MLSPALIVSFYTFKELVKSKILLNTLFLGVGLFAMSFVAYNFTYGEVSRVALDFGLGGLNLSSVAIALFMGASLLPREIESRTVYMIVSRPISRSSFLIGKSMGLIGVLTLNILILSIMTLLCYFIVGGSFDVMILWCLLFTLIEAILTLSMVMCFSLVTTQTLSIMFSIMLYISGHAISGARIALLSQQFPGLDKVLDYYHFALPAFYKFNIKDLLLYQTEISWDYIFHTCVYGVFYILFLLLLSIFIFEKKDLS